MSHLSQDIDFCKYSSIKIGPLVKVQIIDDIQDKQDRYIIGGSNNIVISNNPPKLAVLSKKFDYIKIDGHYLVIGGGSKNSKIHQFCKKNNIGGLEFLSALPGTIGGAIKMNAGMKQYEIKDKLAYVLTSKGYIKAQELNLSYRKTNINDIVYEAKFYISQTFNHQKHKECVSMRSNQPRNPSAGSCFKNPKGFYAGALLEDVGLRGYKVGDVAFSNKHANFLINLGNGKFEDIANLIALAKDKVKQKHNVDLETEIILI